MGRTWIMTLKTLVVGLLVCQISVGLNAESAMQSPAKTWYEQGEETLKRALQKPVNSDVGAAKNIILFVGDGMGVSTLTAARIYEGQQRGGMGEEHQLSFERFPYSGLVKTYNTNQQPPDSAGTMSAMATGIKTKAGFISVDETAKRGDCASSKAAHLPTILDLAERNGKSTGIVSTARVTHATPAALYAHVPERDWENDKSIPKEQAQHGCTDIAAQLAEYAEGDGIEVVMGGGYKQFLDSGGKRGDGRNLVTEWQLKHPSSSILRNTKDLQAWDKKSKVLGLFSDSHMDFDWQRDAKEQPSLTEMTEAALAQLKGNKKGFFLMVESGRIDHGHHIGNAYSALTETVEMAKAVALAGALTDDADTLIIVTADHSHVMTMAGYPTRGNPILGKVVSNDSSGEPEKKAAEASDGMPYTTLGYMNGKGYSNLGVGGLAMRYVMPERTGRHDLSDVDTTAAKFHQEALVPTQLETHGGEDVAVYASGPSAHLLTGNIEQNFIFHVMKHAAGL